MIGKWRRFASWQFAMAILVVIATGMWLVWVVDRWNFDGEFRKSAALIESLRLSPPEGVVPEEWSQGINVSLTAFSNVCTYGPGSAKAKTMTRKILSFKGSVPTDPLGTLIKIWESFYYSCNPQERNYLDKMYKAMPREVRGMKLGTSSDRTAAIGRALQGQGKGQERGKTRLDRHLHGPWGQTSMVHGVRPIHGVRPPWGLHGVSMGSDLFSSFSMGSDLHGVRPIFPCGQTYFQVSPWGQTSMGSDLFFHAVRPIFKFLET